jgi:hypothetical protein
MNDWVVHDGAGGTQFTVTNGESVRFTGLNDTTVTFNTSPQDVRIASTSGVSDFKFKNNIKPIKNSLQKILRLNPVEFNWNDKSQEAFGKKKETTSVGFIAQEVQKVSPESAIEYEAPFTKEKYLGIDGISLIALLTGAVKQSNETIKNLEKRLAKLEK